MTFFKKIMAKENGAAAIEYGLIASLIAMAILASLRSLGGGANGMWGRIVANISAVM